MPSSGFLLPPPKVISELLPDGRTIRVVRDDLIEGGTKVRALIHILRPGREYVYASPAQGYAQIALAVAAKEVGAKATVFVAARHQAHTSTERAISHGANVVYITPGYLSVVTARARSYCEETGARLLPHGLAMPKVLSILANAARKIPAPEEAWCVAGSGTISRALALAWPNTRIRAVRTGGAPEVGKAKLYVAPERFEQAARGERPPFPSCLEYDAKAWRFIVAKARDGALFWNVGG